MSAGRVPTAGLLLALAFAGCASDPGPSPRSDSGTASRAPSSVEVTCTRGTGTEVSSRVVKAAAEGVRVTFADRSGREGAYIAWGWGGNTVAGEPVTDHAPTHLPAPPGDLLLSCAPGADDPITVRVVDPDDHWTVPDSTQDHGCQQDGVYNALPPSTGATELEAVQRLVEDSYPTETTTYEVVYLRGGYRQDSDAGGRIVLRRNGNSAAVGWVARQEDGSWAAQLDGSCAERLGPPYDAMDGYSGEHDVLRVTCLPEGRVAVEPDTVRPAPDGVHTEIVNQSGDPGLHLVYEDADGFGGATIDHHDLSRIDWWRPGQVRVGCTADPQGPGALTDAFHLADPERHWRPDALQATCAEAGQFYAVGTDGDTEQQALDELRARSVAERPIRLVDDGYWRRPGHWWLQPPARPGDDWVYGPTSAGPDGRWHAGVDGTCRPA